MSSPRCPPHNDEKISASERLGAERRGAAGNFKGGGAHFFMNEAVGGEDNRAAELIEIPLKVGDFAAGFLDKEDARSSVPLVEAEFPEAVEAAGGNTSEIERGGTVAANAMRPLGEFAVILEIRTELAVAHGKAGAEKARGERGDFGDGDF